jgi:basic membrane protein A
MRRRQRRRGSGSDVRVGLVTDVGQLNDRGFNQLAFEGVKQAKEELGIEYRVIESASDTDYVPNMQSLADDGYDLIIGVGFAQGEAVATVAKEYPETKFAIIDVDQSSLPGAPDNVVGLLFQEE